MGVGILDRIEHVNAWKIHIFSAKALDHEAKKIHLVQQEQYSEVFFQYTYTPDASNG